MKKDTSKWVIGLLGVTLLLWANPVQSQITGSLHDFSSQGWSGGEICIACHTPHNADAAVPDSPLWNHAVTTATFSLYSSSTMIGTPEQPRGVSRLCLSCHDGTVAVDSFGGVTGTNFISGTADLGTALSDDHPISVLWTHQNDMPGSSTCLNCHFGFEDLLPFFDEYLECATCHDVHNGAGLPRLLRKTLVGSELCLHCHGK